MLKKVLDQLCNAGLIIDRIESLEVDTASIIRCQAEGDTGKKRSGWYRIFSVISKAGNTYYVGSYGNWKNGALPEKGVPIEYDGGGLSVEDREAIRLKQKEASLAADRERKAKTKEAAKRSVSIWEGLSLEGRSPYLAKKKVTGFGIRYTRGSIVVPVRKVGGELVGLQFIDTEGGKKFLTGTPKAGAFHSLGEVAKDAPLIIAEGYATAASIHMATGYPCAVSFDAGNLPKVAYELRKAYPQQPIIIAADNDDAGLKYAQQAAQKVRGSIVAPQFQQIPDGQKLTDFNDLHALEGLESVKAQIDSYLAEAQTADRPALDECQVEATVEAPPEDIEPKSGYKVTQKGVYFVDPNADGDASYRICARLEVKARARTNDGRGWSLHLEFVSHDGKVCEWFAPSRLFAAEQGSRLIEELLDRGLDIDPHRNSKKRLMEYLQRSKPANRVRLTGKMGWNDGAFLSPLGTIGMPVEPLQYYSDRTPLNRAAMNGSLDDWRENVSKYCQGNPVLMFATSIPFAGPLLDWLGMRTIGFHMVGPSSLGKSSITTVAGSVCGGADYFRTWNTTAAALESTAAEHSDSILILDEINQADPLAVGQTVYQLGNEEGKARATDTGAGTRVQHQWRLVWLSNGERSLKEIQSRVGKVTEAGMEMRLLHIRADLHGNQKERDQKGIYQELHGFAHGAALSEFLKLQVAKNHGCAFLTFVEWLTSANESDRKKLVEYIHRRIDDFQHKYLSAEASGQARRAAMGFALIGVCGELATRQGITGWDNGEAEAAASRLFKNFLNDRGGEGNSEDKAILEHICLELQTKGESHFTRWDSVEARVDTHQPRSMTRWGFRKVEDNTAYGKDVSSEEEFYIYPLAFRNELCKGFSYRRACELLAERGALERNKQRGWTYQKRLPGTGDKPTGVYFIKMSALRDLMPDADSVDVGLQKDAA